MQLHLALVLFGTLPPYLIGSLFPRLNELFAGSWFGTLLRHLPMTLDIMSEVNLAVFYFRGTYHDVARRLLRIRHASQ